jgi:hypothetical protein
MLTLIEGGPNEPDRLITEQGITAIERPKRNGKWHGTVIAYWRNTRDKECTEEFVDGIRHGWHRLYSPRTGLKTYEVYYDKGKRVGHTERDFPENYKN